MPLTTAKAPSGGPRAIQNALSRVLAAPNAFLARSAGGAAEDVALSVPHPVYEVGLDDIARGHLTQATRLDGWRYLLVGGERALAAAEVAAVGDSSVRFSHFNEGPFVAATVDGLSAAERLPEVNSGTYEVRLLRIPALYLIALWLHDGKQDLFLPLEPVPNGVKPLQRYREKELVAALQSLSAKRARFDDRPEAAPPIR